MRDPREPRLLRSAVEGAARNLSKKAPVPIRGIASLIKSHPASEPRHLWWARGGHMAWTNDCAMAQSSKRVSVALVRLEACRPVAYVAGKARSWPPKANGKSCANGTPMGSSSRPVA